MASHSDEASVVPKCKTTVPNDLPNAQNEYRPGND